MANYEFLWPKLVDGGMWLIVMCAPPNFCPNHLVDQSHLDVVIQRLYHIMFVHIIIITEDIIYDEHSNCL